jgi:hypothetical protein
MTSPAHTPTAFRPVIRVVGTRPEIDAREYCARLAKAFVPHLNNAAVDDRIAAMLESPVPVVDAEKALRALPRNVATRVRALAAQAEATARETFAAVPDAIAGSEITAVESGQAFRAGTVVWLRNGVEADLQFVFPNLVIDVGTGELDERAPARKTAAHFTPVVRIAAVTMKGVAESAAEVASSVSWALPPPWNVGVTAGLSLLQIIMRDTDDPKASSYDKLKKSFVEYEESAQLSMVANHIRQFNENLLLKTGAFDFDAGQLEAKVGSDALREFDEWWHGSTGTNALSEHIGSVIATLERAKTLKDGEETLKVAAGGVTAWTIGQKVWMQLKAYEQQALAKAGNAAGAADKSLSWRTFFDEMNERLFDMRDPDSGEVVVQGWVSRIEQFMDAKRIERLKQLHVVRTSRPDLPIGYGQAMPLEEWGWRFVDDNVTENDEQRWAHFFPDTKERIDQCHDRTVEHEDEATAAMNAEIGNMDAITKDPTSALKALRARVTEVSELLPPKQPTRAVTVKLKSMGAPTPAGPWKKGATVSYQLAYSNHVDRSELGPATAAVEIGDFAGATLTDFPLIPDGASILISRTIQGDKAEDKIVRNVGFVLKGTASFEDKYFK